VLEVLHKVLVRVPCLAQLLLREGVAGELINQVRDLVQVGQAVAATAPMLAIMLVAQETTQPLIHLKVATEATDLITQIILLAVVVGRQKLEATPQQTEAATAVTELRQQLVVRP
jgi:hypothetical protein